MPQMSQVLREHTIGMLTAGMSTRAVARELNVNFSTISRLQRPSIHPSIFFCLSGARSWGQQSKQRCPDFPLPRHFLLLLPGDISKGAPSHPAEKAHFGSLYPGSCPFSYAPQLIIIGECRNVDWPVNRELRLAAQLLLHHDRLVHRPHYCRSYTNPSVNLPFHPSLTREQDPKILKLVHLQKELSSNLKWASHLIPTEHHGLRLGGADSHPSRFTLGCKPSQCMPKVPVWRGQKDNMALKSRDEIVWSLNRTHSGSWLRLEILSINILNKTGDKGSPAGVQHALGTSLTYLLTY